METEVPLYKCVYRKSVSVTKNLLQVAKGVGMLLLISVLGLVVAYVATSAIIFAWIAASPFLFTIPLWVYGVVAAVLAIPTYSLMWCLDRKPTASKEPAKEFDCQED
jgi:hypothetical protein